VFEIRETRDFSQWLGKLKDTAAEMRIHSGPGYRVYFCRQGQTVIVLLAGGDKSTQKRDIENAQRLAHGVEQTQ